MGTEEIAMETNETNDIVLLNHEESVQNPVQGEVVTNEHAQHQYASLFASKTLLELCHSSWSRAKNASDDVQPYLRGCKWSPDGTCCLSVVNNDGVHITELPRELYHSDVTQNRMIDVLDSVIHQKESGLVYDFCWYPLMNSQYPETCSWITTRQNAPIQMWDAFDGKLKYSYRGFNAVDEMEPAISITFTPDGSKIIAGYRKVLRTFEVERPGRDCTQSKILSPASSLATSDNLLAVGSWDRTIKLYSIMQNGIHKSIGKMNAHSGGITHMKFAADGIRLISGARKDDKLIVWDIRYYRRPLNILTRVVNTNQRVYFDISPCGRYLVSGGTDGVLRMWDSNRVNWKEVMDPMENHDGAIYKYPLHNDCCNGVSIHPCRPILATTSGQHHFSDPTTSPNEENAPNTQQNQLSDISNQPSIGFQSMTENNEGNAVGPDSPKDLKYSENTENCLVFWWTGEIPDLT